MRFMLVVVMCLTVAGCGPDIAALQNSCATGTTFRYDGREANPTRVCGFLGRKAEAAGQKSEAISYYVLACAATMAKPSAQHEKVALREIDTSNHMCNEVDPDRVFSHTTQGAAVGELAGLMTDAHKAKIAGSVHKFAATMLAEDPDGTVEILTFYQGALKHLDRLPATQIDPRVKELQVRVLCERIGSRRACDEAVERGIAIDTAALHSSLAKISELRQEAAQKVAQNQAEARARSAAGRAALLGTLGALASGGNPGMVNMNAQLYLAQRNAEIQAGLVQPRSDQVDINTLASRFAGGAIPARPVGGMSRMAQTNASPGATGGADANRIAAQCNSECASFTQQAKAGSMRASYEAAACTCACFYRAVPANYPKRAEIKQCAIENSRQARALGSTGTAFMPD